MTIIILPNAGIAAGYLEGQGGWSASMNQNLRIIDALLNLRIIDKDLADPPAASSGDAYIVPSGATGEWAGHSTEIALWCIGDDLPAGEWAFITPKDSMRAYVVDEATNYHFTSGTWSIDSGGGTTTEFRQLIGDGSAANFFIDHMLNTRDVSVTIYRNASPWDDVVVDVTRPSVDQVEISGFALAPSVDEYVVVIRKR